MLNRMLLNVPLSLLLLLLFSPQRASVVEWLGPTTYEMGDLIRHEPAEHHFHFRNVSGDSLLIDNVRTSCGCTVPDWADTPIPPDSTGTITVAYDAEDNGHFKKKIKVYFNRQRRAERLFIEGWVVDLD
jgi:hypothetical protein